LIPEDLIPGELILGAYDPLEGLIPEALIPGVLIPGTFVNKTLFPSGFILGRFML